MLKQVSTENYQIEVLSLDVGKKWVNYNNLRLKGLSEKKAFKNLYVFSRDHYKQKPVSIMFEGMRIYKKKGKDVRPGKLGKLYKVDNSKELAYRIWFTYFTMVIEDIIEGNIVKLGKATKDPYIAVGSFDEETSVGIIQHSEALKDVNPMKIGYSIPAVTVYFPKTKQRTKTPIRVRVPERFYIKMLNKIKDGFKYIKIT